MLHPWGGFCRSTAVCVCQRGCFAGVTWDGLTSVLPLGIIIAGLFIGKAAGHQPVLLAGAWVEAGVI